MAGEHCESGYWVVSSETSDSGIRVEHVPTFEQARSRWQALGTALNAEVFAPDGWVVLHRDMEEFRMHAPRVPGLYAWDEARNDYVGAEGMGPA